MFAVKIAATEKDAENHLMLYTNSSCSNVDPFQWMSKSLEVVQSPVSLTKLQSFRLEWGCAHQL